MAKTTLKFHLHAPRYSRLAPPSRPVGLTPESRFNQSRPVPGRQERFLAEFILSLAEGLEMTSDGCIVVPNEERDLSQTEPLS